MFLVKSPWLGWREQIEFSYGGEAHIARPLKPDDISDEEWGQYIYGRKNTKGVHLERWVHTQGCGRWFNIVRHTVTDVIWDCYKNGEEPPMPPEDWDGMTTREEYEAAAAKRQKAADNVEGA